MQRFYKKTYNDERQSLVRKSGDSDLWNWET